MVIVYGQARKVAPKISAPTNKKNKNNFRKIKTLAKTVSEGFLFGKKEKKCYIKEK